MTKDIVIDFAFDSNSRNIIELSFFPAVIRIGSVVEHVWCDKCTWSIEDYSMHWKMSREILLNKMEPVIFCSSLGKKDVEVWIGDPTDDRVFFYNIIAKKEDIKLDGLFVISRIILDLLPKIRGGNASVWDASL